MISMVAGRTGQGIWVEGQDEVGVVTFTRDFSSAFMGAITGSEDQPDLGEWVLFARRPKTVHIRSLGDARLHLLGVIPVTVEYWPDCVTAWSYDLDEYGVGQDEQSAVDDLKASIVELYFLLKGEQAHLGPHPQVQWDFLKRTTVER